MRELLARSADLPDALVGLLPDRLQAIDQRPLQLPGFLLRPEADPAREVHRVHHLAVDVELQLARGGVADADRPRALVARQPIQLQLRQAALARQPIEDLELQGLACGRPLPPATPRARLVDVAGAEERGERGSGV